MNQDRALDCLGAPLATEGRPKRLLNHNSYDVRYEHMRPYGHARTSDRLGRYYTNSAISACLIDSVEGVAQRAVVDLGAGQGALSLAASKRWTDARLATVDIDDAATKVLVQRLQNTGFSGGHYHVSTDALSVTLPNRLNRAVGKTPTLAVCNPPFFVPIWKNSFFSIAEDARLSDCLPPPANTDAALLFLAQNLRLVSRGGTVAIIVPDSMASASKYLALRNALSSRLDLVHAIKLPPMSFSGTEARAHIFILKKNSSTSQSIKLSALDSTSGIVRSIDVERDVASKCLDIDFHQRHSNSHTLTLGDLVIDVRRGSLSSVEVRQATHPVLHTTSIDETMAGRWISLPASLEHPSVQSGTWASAGDIVLGRVGRNAFHKIIGVESGAMPMSDCLFRIRVPEAHQKAILAALSSAAGRQWMEANSHGVAARHISKSGLLKFPLER